MRRFVYIDSIESPQPVRYATLIGMSGALYATAAGRVLLAFQPQAYRDAYLKNAKLVALTLGEQGSLLVSEERALRAKPMRIEVVSAVGAGDSFLGGLVAALARGEALDRAFRVAVAAASAAVMSPGTELCTADDVRDLMPRVEITEVAAAAA